MLLAPHILVGAATAAQFQNPLLGILFAFLSHFVLDAIPHWDYSLDPIKHIKTRGIRYCMPIFLRIALDITTGLVVLIVSVLLISRNEIPFSAWALGGFFGILPDGLAFLLFFKPKNKLLSGFLEVFYAIHRKIHFDKEKGLPPLRIGLSTQAIAILLALYFLIW